MKRLLSLISCLLFFGTLFAQFPIPQGISTTKVYVSDRISIGTSYGATTAKLHVKGAGTTSGTTSMYVENNGGFGMMFSVLDDGATIIRTNTNVRYRFGGTSDLSFINDAGTIRDQTITGATITWNYARFTSSNSNLVPSASSSSYWMNVVTTGTDASAIGSNTLRVFNLQPTWNLSVSSPCDVVGIDYNPTVTSIFGQHYAALFRSGRVGIGTSAPTSTFNALGSQAYSITTVTTTTTAGEHYTILVDATTGAATINLPAVATCPGREYVIMKIDVSANVVTLDGSGGELINGAATQPISNQYAFYRIQNNGTAWYITGNN